MADTTPSAVAVEALQSDKTDHSIDQLAGADGSPASTCACGSPAESPRAMPSPARAAVTADPGSEEEVEEEKEAARESEEDLESVSEALRALRAQVQSVLLGTIIEEASAEGVEVTVATPRDAQPAFEPELDFEVPRPCVGALPTILGRENKVEDPLSAESEKAKSLLREKVTEMNQLVCIEEDGEAVIEDDLDEEADMPPPSDGAPFESEQALPEEPAADAEAEAPDADAAAIATIPPEDEIDELVRLKDKELRLIVRQACRVRAQIEEEAAAKSAVIEDLQNAISVKEVEMGIARRQASAADEEFGEAIGAKEAELDEARTALQQAQQDCAAKHDLLSEQQRRNQELQARVMRLACAVAAVHTEQAAAEERIAAAKAEAEAQRERERELVAKRALAESLAAREAEMEALAEALRERERDRQARQAAAEVFAAKRRQLEADTESQRARQLSLQAELRVLSARDPHDQALLSAATEAIAAPEREAERQPDAAAAPLVRTTAPEDEEELLALTSAAGLAGLQSEAERAFREEIWSRSADLKRALAAAKRSGSKEEYRALRRQLTAEVAAAYTRHRLRAFVPKEKE